MRNTVRTKIRVGKIRYLNCLPFYHRLDAAERRGEEGGLEFFESYPTRINRAMRQGKIDVAPISSLEYLNHPKEYLLLPRVAIGSRDFSGSVLLLARERIEGLDRARIALSRESLSSSALLKILLQYKYKLHNSFVTMETDPQRMLAGNQAALVIGDTALFYRPKEFVYKYDLSELWWNWTEKPFCFAAWAVRRDFAQRHPEEVGAFRRRLQENLERNLADLETLVQEGLGMSFMDEQFSKVFGYLFNLSYGMDAPMQEGLELFFRLANRLGLSPRPGKIEFFVA